MTVTGRTNRQHRVRRARIGTPYGWRAHVYPALLAALALLLTGCAFSRVEPGVGANDGNEWVILPVVNYSDTPFAGERVEGLVMSDLRAHGFTALQMYLIDDGADAMPTLDERARLNKALDWARGAHKRFGVTGAVEEWRYKSGLDGEPAVGVTLRLIDIDSQAVLWSGSASRSGWTRESLAGTGQKVVRELVASMVER